MKNILTVIALTFISFINAYADVPSVSPNGSGNQMPITMCSNNSMPLCPQPTESKCGFTFTCTAGTGANQNCCEKATCVSTTCNVSK